MGSERVTSLDVARLAGVSQSAVSRHFTPGGSVSAKTAAKVRQAAEDLGYRPNVLARSLITGRSRIIGLVVAYLDNYFYPLMVELLSVALQEKGYHVLVFMATPTVGDVDRVMQEILDYQVDGLVLASVSMSSVLAARCQAADIPVVLINRDQNDPRLSAVTTDNRAGGLALAQYLLAGGHQRIGYIAGFAEASTQIDREAGLLAGLAGQGMTLAARESGDFSQLQAARAARAMFSRANRPDAVFVCNDHMAFAVMDVLRFELGLRIPEDVSVVAFDDVPPAAWPAYALTTWRQPIKLMVTETVTILMNSIENHGTPPKRVMLAGALVVRGSARNPAIWP